jgi:CubicO group peptidase (beta-lactamase class C family)
VADVLTMTLGLEWNENFPYTRAVNSEVAMERAPDRYGFVLERPIAGPPGLHWSYNGGATALLGRLIARGVTATLPDYARSALFAPLASRRSTGSASSSSSAAVGTASRWCRPLGSRCRSGRRDDR